MIIDPVERGKPDHYLFVIDTDTYAGGFERQMCAYLTGQVGECGVGKENTKLAEQEIPEAVSRLEEMIKQIPDEHGCNRPVSIFPTLGWFNHGAGGHFRDGQEEEALVDYKKKIKENFEKAHESYIKEHHEKVRAESQQKIDEANALTKVKKFPAYMSVAIYFYEIPDKGLIDLMKQRAKDISTKGVGLKGYEDKVNVTGFRLLEQRTVYKEVEQE